mmetsp:Transcript_28021/g.46369  ORF Transcript_28021/g.46369 Transcript_28021/m.46369 type:complete len:584 (-) Transcript_28021:493-2244(-)
MMKNSLNIAAALGPLVFLVILSLLGQGAHALEVPTNMANLNNLRSAANIQHDNRNLHDVPKNYYYHDKCEAPPSLCGKCDKCKTCDTCGYQRGYDYYQAMLEEWAKTEEAQVADGQWYAPADKTIQCGATITGFTKLNSNLICNANDASSGLVLSGRNAVLDCAKNSIVGPTGTSNSNSIGITLIGGATALNCNVQGFNVGVLMEDGNNIFKDSRVVGSGGPGGGDNIRTRGEGGCMTIDNVETSYSDYDGIDADHNGVINIYNVKANGNQERGVRIQDNVECANLEDIEAVGNGDEGILSESTDLNIINARANGNSDDGIRINNPTECANLENIEASGNYEDDGIDVRHNGILNIKNAKLFRNEDDGIDIDSSVNCANLENIEAFQNEKEGIQARSNIVNIINVKVFENRDGMELLSLIECASLENVEAFGNDENGISLSSVPKVGLYGTITSEFNDQDGLEIFCNISPANGGCEVKVFADVTLTGNRDDGLDFNGDGSGITFTVDACGSVKICSNRGDIGGDDDDDSPTIDGEITCDEINDSVVDPEGEDFECQEGCFANVGSAAACQSPVHAYCYPKPEW